MSTVAAALACRIAQRSSQRSLQQILTRAATFFKSPCSCWLRTSALLFCSRLQQQLDEALSTVSTAKAARAEALQRAAEAGQRAVSAEHAAASSSNDTSQVGPWQLSSPTTMHHRTGSLVSQTANCWSSTADRLDQDVLTRHCSTRWTLELREVNLATNIAIELRAAAGAAEPAGGAGGVGAPGARGAAAEGVRQ